MAAVWGRQGGQSKYSASKTKPAKTKPAKGKGTGVEVTDNAGPWCEGVGL